MKSTVPSDALLLPPVDYEIHSLPAAHSSRRLIAIIGLAACLTLFALYLVLRSAEKPVAPAEPAPPHAQGADVQAMVVRLAARLQEEPENGPGWQMLGKSYAVLGRFADSARAYGRATALLPADASLLADYADVLAMSQSGSFRGEPARLIRKALEIDSRHPKALALAGTEAFKRKDLRQALRYWKEALEFIPADSELAVAVRGGIAEVRKQRTSAAAKPEG